MEKTMNRQDEIRNILSIREKMSINALAEHFKVTGATIRSDIRDMESRNEITRSNGVVSLLRPYVMNLNVKEKIFINAEQKEKIGKAAASMILDRDSIIMTSGTTMEAMARHLVAKNQLNVVTASVSVAMTLSQKEGIETYMLGGKIISSSMSVRNNYTLQGLESVAATKLFIGCDGFDISAGVFTTTLEEASMTKIMMKKAGQVILLSDSTKLGKVGFGHICDMTDIDILITDDDLPVKSRDLLENLGVHVEIV